MPYIKKIELMNFKSFGGSKTSISLDKGFTVITGPNGSGKTNIVDAVLFGLGEMSSRRLRAENFSKLIFNIGGDGRKAKKAKVTIQFDNSDGHIPVDTRNVTIVREVDRNGQSEYRINGKKVSRAKVMEVLSLAGINPSGYNIVLQGTVTRLSDISSTERRRIIEDLIGISLYNAEKSEAEAKLREADIAIKAAMGRVEEVQNRIDELEEERNTLLRYEFIRKETKRLEAILCSSKIKKLEKQIEEGLSELTKLQKKVEELGAVRGRLRKVRFGIEEDWRRVGSEVIDEGKVRLTRIDMELSELRGELNKLEGDIERQRSIINELKITREGKIRRIDELREQINKSLERIDEIESEVASLKGILEEKQRVYDSLSSQIIDSHSILADKAKRINEIEKELDGLYAEVLEKRDSINKRRVNLESLEKEAENLKKLEDRYLTNSKELEKSLNELENVKKEEEGRLIEIEKSIKRNVLQKEKILEGISEAEKIAEFASEAVIEFESQRKITNKIASTEVALRNIEDLSRMGVIKGVYGRLRDLIKIDRKYRKSVEAAAGGWLNALVVKNIEVAYVCAETLKRLKLAKIKIIPLMNIPETTNVAKPKMNGVIGVASSFVKSSKRFRPTISFVFGDTIVVENDKIALELSQEGYRAVTLDGDLYDARGGIEAGYYRSPVDLSSLIPSEATIKSLNEAVQTLKKHLIDRKEYVSLIDEEIKNANLEVVKINDNILRVEDEIERLRKAITKLGESISDVRAQLNEIYMKRDKEKGLLDAEENALKEIEERRSALEVELERLRTESESTEVEELEKKRVNIYNEIVKFREDLGDKERELSILSTNLENILKRSLSETEEEVERIDKQIESLQKNVEVLERRREEIKPEILRLEEERERIAKSIMSARDEAEKLSIKLKSINEELTKVEEAYEEVRNKFNELKLKHQAEQFNLDQQIALLHELNYEEPLEVTEEEVQNAEVTISKLKSELERIGAVNQLAKTQYEEQIKRYKELSVRLNELESEKQSIINFMEEIERRKREAFMNAFNQINASLSEYFKRLTGGGNAYLKLENPEDPFSGGVDMLVQFPNKPMILVGGASGGERSVASVAFLFAIQKLTPASFYLLDEVDAHLDAYHIEKLAELLAEESTKSQFLVITLRPEMASHAQKIYGVYEKGGVSHIVSTTFGEK